MSGKVKEIGVCNFTEKQLMKLMKNCRVKPMYNEIELHPLFQQKDTVEFCEKMIFKLLVIHLSLELIKDFLRILI